jgi:uncharacterized membrane protein
LPACSRSTSSWRSLERSLHKTAGYVWVFQMALVALSSFFIHDLRVVGLFSPIHLLSLFVLANLVRAMVAVRAGRITEHRKTMRGLTLYGLVGAGLFTLWPGRLMHQVLFG